MNADDQGSGDTGAPAASRGARAIGDILAALAARWSEGQPAERRAAADEPPGD